MKNELFSLWADLDVTISELRCVGDMINAVSTPLECGELGDKTAAGALNGTLFYLTRVVDEIIALHEKVGKCANLIK